jgi:CRP-like cAMP-binding protein
VDSSTIGAGTLDGSDTALGVRKSFELVARAGEVIFETGQPADDFFVVQAGEITLVEPADADGVPRLVARLGPGDALGEADALLGRARSASAIAATDARLLRLDRETFRAMCLARPDISVRVMEQLARRVASLEQRLAVLGMRDLVRPVARGLLRSAQPDGAGVRAETTLRKLADACGLSLRETHRGLQELLDRKLVRLVDDALVAPDRAALVASLDEVDENEATGCGLPS